MNFKKIEVLAPLVITFLAITIFFGCLGDVALFNPDEGLYAEPAREMLDTGEYVTTLLNYAVRFTKPPLIMWVMVLSYKLFGVNEFAARLFCAGCGTALILSTYYFLSRYLSTRTSFIASLILLTAPMTIAVGRMAITDMPLALFMAGAVMLTFSAFKEKKPWLQYPAYVLVGLAVMTKGPIGALLPTLIMAAFFLINKKWRSALSFFNIPLGFIIIGLIALPWFAYEIYLTKGAYFQEFILRENFQRYTSVIDSHKGGWWYHLAAVFAGMFPWSVFLPQALFAFFADKFKGFQSDDAGKQIQLLATCWVVITVAFFSASVSKLLSYTLPAFPALAILVAMEIEEAVAAKSRRRLALPLLFIALVFAFLMVGATYCLQQVKEAPLELAGVIASFSLWQLVFSLVSLALVYMGQRMQSVICFALAFVIGILCFGKQFLSTLSITFEGDVPTYARYASNFPDPIVVFDLRKPGIPFYTLRKVIQPPDVDSLREVLQNIERAYVITRVRDLNLLDESKGYKVIDRDSRFALLDFRQRH
jgi:4-amino-4-deoxy-L-arabinose transferase-like glycosyltransferase